MLLKIVLSWCLKGEIPSICVWCLRNQALWYLLQTQTESTELCKWPALCKEVWIHIQMNPTGPFVVHALYQVVQRWKRVEFGLVLHFGTVITMHVCWQWNSLGCYSWTLTDDLNLVHDTSFSLLTGRHSFPGNKLLEDLMFILWLERSTWCCGTGLPPWLHWEGNSFKCTCGMF